MKIKIKNTNHFIGKLIYNGFKVEEDRQKHFINPITLKIEKILIKEVSFKKKKFWGETWDVGKIIESPSGDYYIIDEDFEEEGSVYITKKFLNILRDFKEL